MKVIQASLSWVTYLLIFLLEVVNLLLLISDHIVSVLDLFFESGDLSLKSPDFLVEIIFLLVQSAYLLLGLGCLFTSNEKEGCLSYIIHRCIITDCSTIRYSIVQYSTYSIVRYSIVQYSILQYLVQSAFRDVSEFPRILWPAFYTLGHWRV